MSSAYDRPGLPHRAAQPGQVPARTVRERGFVLRRLCRGDGQGREVHRPRRARARGGDPGRGLPARCAHLLLRQRRSASIANHMQCDHVKGVRTATDLSPACAQPQRQRGTPHRDSERHRLREHLRLPASVPVGAGRRAPRGLLVRPFAQYRPRAHLGPRPRPANHRHHRLRRGRRPGPPPRSASMSTARTTASSRTCTRPSCTPWPSTSASRE